MPKGKRGNLCKDEQEHTGGVGRVTVFASYSGLALAIRHRAKTTTKQDSWRRNNKVGVLGSPLAKPATLS